MDIPLLICMYFVGPVRSTRLSQVGFSLTCHRDHPLTPFHFPSSLSLSSRLSRPASSPSPFPSQSSAPASPYLIIAAVAKASARLDNACVGLCGGDAALFEAGAAAALVLIPGNVPLVMPIPDPVSFPLLLISPVPSPLPMTSVGWARLNSFLPFSR